MAQVDVAEPGRRDIDNVLRESDRRLVFSVCGLPQSLPRICAYALCKRSSPWQFRL